MWYSDDQNYNNYIMMALLYKKKNDSPLSIGQLKAIWIWLIRKKRAKWFEFILLSHCILPLFKNRREKLWWLVEYLICYWFDVGYYILIFALSVSYISPFSVGFISQCLCCESCCAEQWRRRCILWTKDRY